MDKYLRNANTMYFFIFSRFYLYQQIFYFSSIYSPIVNIYLSIFITTYVH